MSARNLIIHKLEGYAGIRLKGNKTLTFKPGLNLLVGRNGSGKTNMIRLIQQIASGQGDVKSKIESSFFYKRVKMTLRKRGSSMSKNFGEVPILKYSFLEKKGSIIMSLKTNTDKHVLENILSDSSGFDGVINITGQTAKARFRSVDGGHNPPKFEMAGYLNFNLFSREHGNAAHTIMEGPMREVSVFMREKMLSFYEGPEFVQKITELEHTFNSRFTAFLGNTNKTIKINYGEIRNSGRISLSLMDNGNYIQSIDLSTGEMALLNLIFFLITAKEEGWDIISFDEPDIHMHDDMIQVLVRELSELSAALPNCIIVIASHSTAFIEKLAVLGRSGVNIVSLDDQRRVANSQEDIELINALTRNGVSFSPLMLSKRQNIFIENQLRGEGKNYRDFFLKFFPEGNKPNIVPIGNSGNVQDSKTFSGVFTELLKVSDINLVGIQDGDIWFKDRLIRYLKGELSLSRFLHFLKRQKGAYIQSASGVNSYYFNFWEIENLYLMPEVLICWIDKRLNPLTVTDFKVFLNGKLDQISNQYFSTFYKSIVKIRPKEKVSVTKVREQVNGKLADINRVLMDDQGLEVRMKLLVESILKNNLLQWIPGKEIKDSLEKSGYTFNDSKFGFEKSKLAISIRRIQSLETKS